MVAGDADDPVDVDLWASDRLLGTVRADRFRQDLKRQRDRLGEHAFTFKIPDALRDGPAATGSGRTSQALRRASRRSPLLLERRSHD